MAIKLDIGVDIGGNTMFYQVDALVVKQTVSNESKFHQRA